MPGTESPEDRCPDWDSPTTLLRYEPPSDSWVQLPGPPDGLWDNLTTVGDRLVAYASSEESGERRDWIFDPDSESWAELPEDPLPRTYDRSIVAIDGGRALILIGADAEVGPSPDPAGEQNLAASLDLSSGDWTTLDPSPGRGYRAWAVDDAVVLEPHFGGAGGVLRPMSGTWEALPAESPDDLDSLRMGGVIGVTGGVYLETSGWVLDIAASRWIEIEPLDDRVLYPPSSITAVGRDLFLHGGARWSESAGELLGDAWMWIAPEAPSTD